MRRPAGPGADGVALMRRPEPRWLSRPLRGDRWSATLKPPDGVRLPQAEGANAAASRPTIAKPDRGQRPRPFFPGPFFSFRGRRGEGESRSPKVGGRAVLTPCRRDGKPLHETSPSAPGRATPSNRPPTRDAGSAGRPKRRPSSKRPPRRKRLRRPGTARRRVERGVEVARGWASFFSAGGAEDPERGAASLAPSWDRPLWWWCLVASSPCRSSLSALSEARMPAFPGSAGGSSARWRL